MARTTKAERIVREEDDESAETEPIRERWGFSMRVACVNNHCVAHGDEQMVRVQRAGDVYLVPYFHCAKCLYQMIVVNPEIAEPLGMGMAEDD